MIMIPVNTRYTDFTRLNGIATDSFPRVQIRLGQYKCGAYLVGDVCAKLDYKNRHYFDGHRFCL